MPLVLIMLQYLWLGTDFAIAEAVNFVVESERQGSTTLREKMDDQQCELEDLKLKLQGRINGVWLKVWRSKERKAMLFFAACYASTGSRSLTTFRFMMWSICFATCGWIVVSALWWLVYTFLAHVHRVILAVQWTCYGVICLFCFWAVYGVKWCWLSYYAYESGGFWTSDVRL